MSTVFFRRLTVCLVKRALDAGANDSAAFAIPRRSEELTELSRVTVGFQRALSALGTDHNGTPPKRIPRVEESHFACDESPE